MIVVDTNLIVYFLAPGEWTAQAEQARAKDPQWAAPLLWRSEFRNVLALYIRHRGLKLQEAKRIMADALSLMSGQEHAVASSRVLDLAAASSCSAYDCEFVALAQELGVRLVTVDRQILQEFPKVAIALGEFVAA